MYARIAWVLVLWFAGAVAAEDVQLSSYVTKYRSVGTNASRASNVELAASRVSGIEVWPGDTFSYNQVVGERSAANGFRLAHVIKDKKLVDDWGGGACQVASTLHAAALLAGLDIVESHPHSLASAYMQPGMDSTVAWPTLDLKFRNNTQRPIKISAVAVQGLLSIVLFSDRHHGRAAEVTFETLKRWRRPTWTVKSREVKQGSKVDQSGSDGLLIRRHYKVWDTATGEVYVRQTKTFKFAPLARIVLIPRA